MTIALDELWDIVRRIPSGTVASYGAVGRALSNPSSGYMVGRWMAQCPADVPWWRVVGKDGHLPVNKRSPDLARTQRDFLAEEGVPLDGHRVLPDAFIEHW